MKREKRKEIKEKRKKLKNNNPSGKCRDQAFFTTTVTEKSPALSFAAKISPFIMRIRDLAI